MKPQTFAALAAMAIAPAGAQAAGQLPAEALPAEALPAEALPAEAMPVEAREGDEVRIDARDSGQQGGTVHTVVKGDTLWDLSEKYLGSPWYWPKVWSYNPQIDNPHWIYPGNLIRFNPMGNEGQAEEMPTQITVEQPESEGADEDDRHYLDDELVTVSEGKTIGLVPYKEGTRIRQESFISPQEFKAAGTLESAFSEKKMLSLYDKVYLRFGDPLAVRLGEVYSIFRVADEIVHPVSGESYGHRVDVVGTVRVTALHSDLITGIVESAADEILRGDLVAPLGDFDKNLVHHANEREVRGIVIASQNPLLPLIGEHHVVFIDKGERDGVQEGNNFEVIRRGDPMNAEDGATADVEGQPEEAVGQIVVFDVKENASAGIVVRSLRELKVGEEVLMRARPRAAQR